MCSSELERRRTNAGRARSKLGTRVRGVMADSDGELAGRAGELGEELEEPLEVSNWSEWELKKPLGRCAAAPAAARVAPWWLKAEMKPAVSDATRGARGRRLACSLKLSQLSQSKTSPITAGVYERGAARASDEGPASLARWCSPLPRAPTDT